MGILSDFFVATSEHVTAENLDGGPTGTFPTFQARRLTPLEMAELLQVVRGDNSDPVRDCLDAFPLLLTSHEESWVFGCPVELRDALSEATEEDLAAYARGWSVFEELKLALYDRESLQEVLIGIAALARLARTRHESMFLWMCL